MPSSCSQTLNGLVNDCAASMGGVVEIYIANYADVTGVTETTNKISAITMATDAVFKKYALPRNTASLSSNYTISEENGTKYVVSDLVMQVNKMDTVKRIEISALAQGELAVIVKDANGLLWYLGKDAPVKATAGDGLTGTARGDRNGYSITLQDNSLLLPLEVEAAALAAVLDD